MRRGRRGRRDRDGERRVERERGSVHVSSKDERGNGGRLGRMERERRGVREGRRRSERERRRSERERRSYRERRSKRERRRSERERRGGHRVPSGCGCER